ncbi:MAG: class I adenylate-forming enzyme family protein [Gammaproteobacteria bacterium]
MNICSLLQGHATDQADKIALRQGQTSIEYGELWRRVEACAACLYQAGVRPGHRVALSLADHQLHLILHYALPRIGAVILPIDHRWSSREKSAALHAFSAHCIVVDKPDETLNAFTQLSAGPDWYAEDSSDLPDIQTVSDEMLLISLSSGTTGRPKGALISHQQMYQRFVSQWETLGFNPEDRFIAATPLFFGAGRSFAMSFLAIGAELVLFPPPYEPEALVETINNSRANCIFLVPTLLRRLLPLAGDGKLLPGIDKLVVSGAALYPEEAVAVREKISSGLLGYYASSEGGGISVLQTAEFAEYGHTAGRATFRTEIQIVDADGNEVAVGETGRLRYRGPGVATVFIDSDGQESGGDDDGWFAPGDLACKLESGHIVLRGRDKEVIIRGGVNIYPAEIEAVLMQHDAVVEAAVLGEPSATLGEDIAAFVVTGTTVSDAEMTRHCQQNMAPYKLPRRFVFSDTLPKKTSGKIDKQALQAQLNSQPGAH